MTARTLRKEGRIFYDVDTQKDFMNEDGALYVPEAETIKENLGKITLTAQMQNIRVLGSVDLHYGTFEYKEREGELKLWGGPFPDHCMRYTTGQQKIPETSRILLSHAPSPASAGSNMDSRDCSRTQARPVLQRGVLDTTQIVHSDLDIVFKPHFLPEIETSQLQKIARTALLEDTPIYIEKQSYDVFTNPLAEVLLREAGVKEAIVYGVATDFCVKAAVLGMHKRGIQCYVVKDAIKGVFPDKSKEALAEMAEAGAKFVTTSDILEYRI